MKIKALLPRSLQARIDMGRRAVTDFVAEVARDLPDGAIVVDAGAGEGYYAEHFTRQRYYAVDFAAGEMGWDYTSLAARADLLHMPLADGCVDVLLTTQTLEHIHDPPRFLREIARVLAPGGKLYLTAPQGFKEHQEPYDFFRYTRFALAKLCEDAGLEVDFVRPQGGYFRLIGDRIQPFYRYAFSDPERHWWKRALMPIVYLPLKATTTVFAPLACLLLDPFETKRQHTVGYEVGAGKPEGSGA